MIPFGDGVRGRSFRERIVLAEFDALPPVAGDSAADVSDDRERG